MLLWKRFTQFVLWTFFSLEEPNEQTAPAILEDVRHLSTADLIQYAASGSCNTATNRSCWMDGFDINTDYEKKIPPGITRQFYLELTNEYIAPDGYNVSRMLFNKTYPGPLLEGNWGDTFNITVKNKLTNHNGTSIHWHGIRQLNTNWYDGVSGVTECPIPPGDSFTYTWRATQYGVSWYHSHFSLQYPDGLVGPLKINGPTSKNYTEDLGPVLITDHFHKTAFEQVGLEYLGRPPSPDTMLMNGNGTYYCCPRLDSQCLRNSKLTTFNFKAKNTYKMSLVNTATSTHMTFWIDGHSFWVVGTDFVPIKPYLKTLNIAIGQRYDIIVEANASTATQTDFWIHARDCANGGARSNLGIIRYNSTSKTIPYTPPPSEEHICYGCLDELSKQLQPIVPRTVTEPANIKGKGKSLQSESLKVHLVSFPDESDKSSALHKWVLKDSSLYLDWTEPSLSLLNIADEKGWTKAPFPKGYEPVYLDYEDNSWVYFLIEGKFQESLNSSERKIYKIQAPVAHPIHVHGHDFVVLATGTEEYDPKKVELNLNNPPRRDVALLPVNGYLVIAFEINNPGAWLMHCHIAWHASGGLALQFVEKPGKISQLFRQSGVIPRYSEKCTNWGAYYSVFNKPNNATQEDSGI